MGHGECYEGNKTNRMMRLGETEGGNLRQLWSQKSLLRKWYLSQDLKDENEPFAQKPGRSVWGQEHLWGAERKQGGGSTWGEGRGDQEVKHAPWWPKSQGNYYLDVITRSKFSVVCYGLLYEIACKYDYLPSELGPAWIASQSLTAGGFSLLNISAHIFSALDIWNWIMPL